MSDLNLTKIGTILTDHKTTFVGKGLKGSIPVLNKNGNHILRHGAQCAVTKIRYSDGRTKALRMWYSESDSLKNICEHISRYIEQKPAPYLLNMSYISNAIYFNNEYYPALLMDWCEGSSLREYLNNNIKDKRRLGRLKSFLIDMFKNMNIRCISHGDIHHNNIYVSAAGAPFLIDYDSMYVPSLKGVEDNCLGYSGFQLPNAREKNKFLSYKTDYFSQLIVIMTIECLIQDSGLWLRYYDEDDESSLLFRKEDYLNLNKSNIYSEIKNLKGDVPFLLNVLEHYLQKLNINELWPFYETVNSTEKKQEISYCINCGRKTIESIDRYCTNCGTLIYA